jgi:peptide/nickel transport system permease protein
MSIIAFIIIDLPPGDYVDGIVAGLRQSGATVSAEFEAKLREDYGLDKPVYVRYAKWIWKILHGDFGRSQGLNQPVTAALRQRLPLTVVVSLSAMLVSWGVALPIGIYSAVRQYSIGDYIFTVIGFLGLAIPNFLLALALLYLGYKYLDIDLSGLFSPEFDGAPWSMAKVWDLIKHLWVPAIVIGMGAIGGLIRVMRANLLDELHKPYVVTARAKGLSETRLILKYPVRMALNPFASFIGYWLPNLVGGGTLVAIVLGLQTMGPAYLTALIQEDMFLAGAMVLLLGVLTIIGTFISDILLVIVDPRIRMEGGQR